MNTIRKMSGISRIFSLLLLSLFCLQASAQTENATFKTIKGILKDSKTNETVAFASVFVSGTSVGTVSNTEGEFTLKVKENIESTSIEIMHLGYKTKKIPINELNSEINNISLESTTITLKEVNVRHFEPNELLEEMMKNVEQNYGTKPNMMTGFYRESIKKKSNYIYISEAIVDIYKSSYTAEYEADNVKVFKGRKSQRIKGEDTLMVKMRGGPSVALLLDIIRNPYILFDKEEISNYEFSLGEMKIIDNKPLYVLEFRQKYAPEKALFNGKLYINSESLALAAAEFSMNLANVDAATRSFIQKKPLNLRFEPVNTKYMVKYKEENGKYYYNYARYELNFTCDWKKKLFKSKYEIMAEIAITDRDSQNVQKIERKDRVYNTDVFSEKVSAFTDADFWGSENFIEPNQSIEESLAKYAKWLKKTSHN